MADEVDFIEESATYPEKITLIQLGDVVQGGKEGKSNEQATQLANRTKYLNLVMTQMMQIVSHYIPQGIAASLTAPNTYVGLTIQELNIQINAESLTGDSVTVSLQSLAGDIPEVDVRVLGTYGDDNTSFGKVIPNTTVTTQKVFLFDAVPLTRMPFIKVLIITETKWWEFVVNVARPTGEKTYCTLEPKSLPSLS
jgi:hypothetical protein